MIQDFELTLSHYKYVSQENERYILDTNKQDTNKINIKSIKFDTSIKGIIYGIKLGILKNTFNMDDILDCIKTLIDKNVFVNCFDRFNSHSIRAILYTKDTKLIIDLLLVKGIDTNGKRTYQVSKDLKDKILNTNYKDIENITL